MATVLQALDGQIQIEENDLDAAQIALLAQPTETEMRDNIRAAIEAVEALADDVRAKREQLAEADEPDWAAIEAEIKAREKELSNARAALVDIQGAAKDAASRIKRISERITRGTARLDGLKAQRKQAEMEAERHNALLVKLNAPPVTNAQANALAGQLDNREVGIGNIITVRLTDLARERRRLEDLRRSNMRTLRDQSVDLGNATARVRFGTDRETAEAQTRYERKRAEVEEFLAGAAAQVRQVTAFVATPLPQPSPRVVVKLTELHAALPNRRAADDALALVEREKTLDNMRLAFDVLQLRQLADPAVVAGTEQADLDAAVLARDNKVDEFTAARKNRLDEFDGTVPDDTRQYLLRMGDAREIVDRLQVITGVDLKAELNDAEAALAAAVQRRSEQQRTHDVLESEVAALGILANGFEETYSARALAAARGDDLQPVKIVP